LIPYLLLRKKIPERLGLITTGIAGVVLSLGPYLQMGHVLPPGAGLRLPIFFLNQLSTAFSVFKAPGRAHVVVFFAVLFAAGSVLWYLREQILSRYRFGPAAWFCILLLFLALNVVWGSRLFEAPVFPALRVPEFYAQLGQKPGRGAIMDVPISYYDFPHYNYYQFWHKRPVVSPVLYHDAIRAESTAFIQSKPTLVFFTQANFFFASPEIVKEIQSSDFLDYLGGKGIEYVTVHPRFIDAILKQGNAHPQTREFYASIEEVWSRHLIYQDDLIRVYKTAMLK